jgi:hypothetical protein
MKSIVFLILLSKCLIILYLKKIIYCFALKFGKALILFN